MKAHYLCTTSQVTFSASDIFSFVFCLLYIKYNLSHILIHFIIHTGNLFVRPRRWPRDSGSLLQSSPCQLPMPGLTWRSLIVTKIVILSFSTKGGWESEGSLVRLGLGSTLALEKSWTLPTCHYSCSTRVRIAQCYVMKYWEQSVTKILLQSSSSTFCQSIAIEQFFIPRYSTSFPRLYALF